MDLHTGWTEFEYEGNRFAFALAVDDAQSMPWDNEDGHGPVREISCDCRGHSDKRPGEVVIGTNGRTVWLYDFAEACKIARRDGWGFLPGKLETSEPVPGTWQAKAGNFVALGDDINAAIRNLYASHRASMSPKAYAAGAAKRDMERLRAFLNSDWCYVGVIVYFADDDGQPLKSEGNQSLWGIESDSEDYHAEVAEELAAELLEEFKAKAG